MNEPKKILVTEGMNRRVDVYLSENIQNISRSKIKHLINAGHVLLIRDNKESSVIDPSAKVKLNDILVVNVVNESISDLKPQNMDISVLYEDEYLLVINKTAGMVVHPGAGNYENTLVNGLLFKYNGNLSKYNGEVRPGIVHRLDKDTSGVLVVAKDDNTHAQLAKQFESHSINRAYRALLWGILPKKKGSIETFIKRSEQNRLKMAVHATSGKKAITDYKVLYEYKTMLSLVDVSLKTGRTHQIRVHMSSLGHSVVGDSVYGSDMAKYFNKLDTEVQTLIKSLNRYALHAYKLGFIHPISKEYMEIKQNEPQELMDLYHMLGYFVEDTVL